jgi:hypothetical protein
VAALMYEGTRDCAALGCDRDNRDDPDLAGLSVGEMLYAPARPPHDAILSRISPKGAPFVGLCQAHQGTRRVMLKAEAAKLMDRAWVLVRMVPR